MQPSQPGAPTVYSFSTEQSYQKKPQAIFHDKVKKEIEVTGNYFYSASNYPWHFLQHFPHETKNLIQRKMVWGGKHISAEGRWNFKSGGQSDCMDTRDFKKLGIRHHFPWKMSTNTVWPNRKSQHKIWALIWLSGPVMVQFSVKKKMLVSLRETLSFTLWKGSFLFSSLLLVRKIYTLQIIAVSLCWSYSGFVIQ